MNIRELLRTEKYEEIINWLWPKIWTSIGKYMYEDIEEYIAVAKSAVAIAVLSVPDDHPDPIGYILVAVNRRVHESVFTRIFGPKNTYYRKHNEPLPPRLSINMEKVGDYRAGPWNVTELKEEIEICCRTDFERLVINYRIQGFRDQEIADILDTNKVRVGRAKLRVWKRFKERWYA